MAKNFRGLLASCLMIMLCLLLAACGRSKPTQFYILNPVPLPQKSVAKFRNLQIGIDSIETPAYTSKPQIMLYQTQQQVSMEEYHQWAESLDKSIKRIVASNLRTMLPGAVVENAPWSIQFKPAWHLQISIAQFKADTMGRSDLRASYQIYYQDQLMAKQDRFYRIKASNVSMDALVGSMNVNLTQFTRDIARTFSVLKAG